MNDLRRRLCSYYLYAALVLAFAAAIRTPYLPGAHGIVGAALFIAMCAAACVLGLRGVGVGDEPKRQLALSGGLLIAPFALVSLLWVGLGPPWEATPEENRMRYLVLLVMATAVTLGFAMLTAALRESGERTYSALGFATSLLAGAAYVVWLTFAIGAHVAIIRDGKAPAVFGSLGDALDSLLFVACALTYLATAIFAAALGRVGWIGPRAATTYLCLNLLVLGFLMLRGLSFPNPTAASTPWYLSPGFIAGIPAVPWVMPYFFGVIFLRRAGDSHAPN